MIGQYLSNTNESTIVSILQNILELNKTREGQFDNNKRNGRNYLLFNIITIANMSIYIYHGKYSLLLCGRYPEKKIIDYLQLRNLIQ